MTAAKIETTHRATLENGPSVVDHELVWTSASGMTTADPQSVGGCLRKWWYEQVLGRRQPSTPAQKKGTKLHAEIDTHLTTGTPLLSQLAIAGRGFIPERGPGIFSEASLGDVKTATLKVGPRIPVLGHVDLWNIRGTFHNPAGDLLPEPRARTIETRDWKTTSDFTWAKSPDDLAKNIQLVTYSVAGFMRWPDAEHARHTHVYFRTQGKPEAKLVTVLQDREQVERRLLYADGIAATMADAARETDPHKVDANHAACNAYRGCPHRSYCRAGSHDSLAELLGPRGAAAALARLEAKTGAGLATSGTEPTKGSYVSLIDKMKPSALVAPIPAAAGVGVQLTVPVVDAEVAALQAQEAARRAQAAAGIPTGFQDAVLYLRDCGRGWPKLTGRAAAACGAVEIEGTGWLATKCAPVEDPEALMRLVAEVRTLPPLSAEPAVIVAPPPAPTPPAPPPSLLMQSPPATMAAVLPPDAPASNPAIAATPVEGLDNAKTRELAALTTVPGLVATAVLTQQTGALPTLAAAPPMLSTAAPFGSLLGGPTPPAAVPIVPVETTQTQPPGAEAAKPTRKRGRPAGSKSAPNIADQIATPGEVAASRFETAAINLFVNAMPSCGFESLHPYIDTLCAALCAEYSAADIQCAPKDGPLGFGKWQGALRALARQSPPAAGSYFVRSNGTDLAAVVVEALRNVTIESGGMYVEGVA